MANVPYYSVLVLGTQVDEDGGSFNIDVNNATQVYTADIEAATPAFSGAQGVKIIDDSFSGEALRRIALEGETVNTGSGTRDNEHLVLLEGPDTFSFQTRLQGGGHSDTVGETTPADGDFDFPPAIRFLFESLGVVRDGVLSDNTNSTYSGGQPTYLTFSWMTGSGSTNIRFKYGACLVESVSIVFPPGEPAIATWTVKVGHFLSRAGGNFPNFPNLSPPTDTVGGYGVMDTRSALPFIQAAATIQGVTRKPGELVWGVTQGIEVVGNGNNFKNGKDLFPTNERTVSLAGTYFLDDASEDQVFDDMALDLSINSYFFQYGTGPGERIKFTIPNGVNTVLTPAPAGNQYVQTLDVHGTAVGGVDGSEFSIVLD